MRRAVIQQLGSLPTYRYGVETYDPDKLGLGPLIFQYTGAGNEDKFAGPLKVGLARPMEQSTAIASQYPWATPGDASTVPTWYEISAIATDTGLTLASTAGTVGASAYIIEDLRACLGVTRVTNS